MPWFDAQNIAFCVLTIMSTVITIYSICKIFETSKQLSATNQNVHINLRTMICHSSLLIVSSLIAIGYNTPYDKMPRIASVIYVSLPVIDIIVQLLICYICWTVGSSEQLKRFDCILIEDG
jgi:hypothetical protein